MGRERTTQTKPAQNNLRLTRSCRSTTCALKVGRENYRAESERTDASSSVHAAIPTVPPVPSQLQATLNACRPLARFRYEESSLGDDEEFSRRTKRPRLSRARRGKGALRNLVASRIGRSQSRQLSLYGAESPQLSTGSSSSAPELQSSHPRLLMLEARLILRPICERSVLARLLPKLLESGELEKCERDVLKEPGLYDAIVFEAQKYEDLTRTLSASLADKERGDPTLSQAPVDSRLQILPVFDARSIENRENLHYLRRDSMRVGKSCPALLRSTTSLQTVRHRHRQNRDATGTGSLLISEVTVIRAAADSWRPEVWAPLCVLGERGGPGARLRPLFGVRSS